MTFLYEYVWVPVKLFLAKKVHNRFLNNSRVRDSLMFFGLGIERLLQPSRNKRVFAEADSTVDKYGVNLSGVLRGEFGMGKSGHSIVNALVQAEIPYVINKITDPYKHTDTDNKLYISSDDPYQVNVIHVSGYDSHKFFATAGSTYFDNKYNIAYWMLETDSVPEEWHASYKYYDEIWVPTRYTLDVISSVSPVPVVKIPISVNIDEELISRDRSAFSLRDEDYIFLFNFDFNSSFNRKNSLGLIKAFKKAFKEKDNVSLLIKYINHESDPDNYEKITSAVKGFDNIHLIEGHLEKEKLYSLVACVDCYVSLHRSEGFGLTIAEAMYLGKPVIATGYSGNMDFMNVNNSYPVKYQMTEIGEKEYPPFRRGFYWADPDLDHAAGLMRYVYENPGEAGEIGEKAAEYIKKNFSPKAVGKRIRDRLDMIYDSGL